jgi:hypothetical protein
MKKKITKTKKYNFGNKKKKTTRLLKTHKNYKSYKMYGGDNDVSQIMEQVKSQRKVDLGNIEIIKNLKTLLQGLFLKATQQIASMANVDLSNPVLIEQKLEQIKTALYNPKNKEKLKEIITELSKNGVIAIQAASPFLKEFSDKVLEIGSKNLSEWGEAIVKIGLNTAQEVPGVGILIGAIRSIGNIGEAVTSSVNSASQLITAAADSINGSILNYKKIAKENMQRMNNINQSINEFQQNSPFGSPDSNKVF